MSSAALTRALERAESVLLPLPTVEGALARREAGMPAPEDAALVRERVAAIMAAQGADGSWNGSLEATGAALIELAELAAGDADLAPVQGVSEGLAWLRSLRGGTGRFGQACATDWHEAGLCQHTLEGFHAPAPASGEPGEADTLVIDSARATEAGLRWGEVPAGSDLDGLRRIVSHWAWPRREPLLKAASAVAALSALLRAPATPENVRAIAEGIACLLRSQRADGTWHGVPLYDAMELLLAGVSRGYRVPEVDAALGRAAQLLVLTQKSDGSWGAETRPRQPLSAWRVLRHALGLTAGVEPASPDEAP